MPFWAPRRASGLNASLCRVHRRGVLPASARCRLPGQGPRRQPDSLRHGDRPNLPPARRETLASRRVTVGFAGIVAGARRQ